MYVLPYLFYQVTNVSTIARNDSNVVRQSLSFIQLLEFSDMISAADIIRLLFMVPIYAIVSLLSFILWV